MVTVSLNGNGWKIKDYLGEDWVWRNAEKRRTKDVRWWRPASVPGSITDDLYRCREIPDPYYEKNSLLIEWIPERTWVYRREFTVEEALEGKRVFLCFEGVDQDASFYLNDVYLGEHHSMFTPVEFEVTGLLEQGELNLLAVVLKKAPEGEPQVSKTRYVKTHKCRMNYWWDFCPRMIHMGIWDDVFLKITGAVRLGRPDVETRLLPDRKEAQVTAFVSMDFPSRVSASIYLDGRLLSEKWAEAGGPESKAESTGAPADVLQNKARFRFSVENPVLWQPDGRSGQPLYSFVFRSVTKDGVSDERTVRFGIRDLVFLKNEGADDGSRPYTLCVNGKKLFMKGYNWVPADVLYGVRREEKLKRLIRLLQEAHVNIVRVWGGGLIEREDFYDLCDENGILIWQEFIQSSSGIENEPSADTAFLKLMSDEAAVIIPRKKHHPSLAVWGGGNELSGEDNAMISEDVPVIRVLAGAVKKYDPSRYFLESSPTGRIFNNTLENIAADPAGLHDVHGPWEHQGLKAQYTLYNAGVSLLSSEFGVEGMANYDTLEKSMSPARMWPPSRDNSYYFHRGSWWNNYPLLQECFGHELSEIRQTVRASQFMQYEGLKYAVEANRRRAFTESGTFPWQFNEPYPNNTCTCSVDYYAQPKPAYYGVKRAYEPYTVTARFAAQTLREETDFSAEIFWQSSEADRKPACIRARVAGADGGICAEEVFSYGQRPCEAEKAVFCATFSCPADRIKTDIFYLLLEALSADGQILAENRYLFTKTSLAALLHLKETEISAGWEEKEATLLLRLENTGTTSAAGLWLEDARQQSGAAGLFFSENYLYLMPGEMKRIEVAADAQTGPRVRMSAFNAAENYITRGPDERVV